MEYQIEVLPRAAKDLDQIYRRVVARAPYYRGPLWFERLVRAIYALRTIVESSVKIIHVRHGRRIKPARLER